MYSFRRCPYAMRARLGVAASGQRVELREILLRDKPPAFLAASPSGTVPCLVGDRVIDESLDIMIWALTQSDPQAWLDMPDAGHDLIATCDGPFKSALDRTKYGTRYPDCDPAAQRALASEFLMELEGRLVGRDWLFGGRPRLADMAMLPFVRQFAHIDRAWFDAQSWPNVTRWLDRFLVSEAFTSIMTKYPPWRDGDAPTYFPA